MNLKFLKVALKVLGTNFDLNISVSYLQILASFAVTQGFFYH